MIALQECAQGDEIAGNVKKKMLQNWTTTLIDDTNLFMRYIHHVRYHLKACLFVFPLVHYLLWLPGRNVRKMIIFGAMSTNTCSKIAPLFEIQHVLFRRISVQCICSGYAYITQNMTYHALSIQSDQFCNFSFWTLPQIYSSYTCPSETIITN